MSNCCDPSGIPKHPLVTSLRETGSEMIFKKNMKVLNGGKQAKKDQIIHK